MYLSYLRRTLALLLSTQILSIPEAESQYVIKKAAWDSGVSSQVARQP